jgi:hypothetical protein
MRRVGASNPRVLSQPYAMRRTNPGNGGSRMSDIARELADV